MPRLIKGASYSRDSIEPFREGQSGDWEQAGINAKQLDPEGIEALRLLRELKADSIDSARKAGE